MSAVRRHSIITFFVLAYAISWAFLPIESVGFLPSGPLLAALIVIPITQGRAGLRELGSRLIRWRVRWYWYAVAIGLPLAVHLAIVGLNVAAGAGVPSLTFTSLTTFLIIFAVRLVNPADGPLGEHPGWNGVAATSCSTPGTAPWTISRLSAATISAHKWQRPQDRGRRQSLGRGLRDLRMHRYGNLQTTAMMLHARDLVDEVFAEMKREAAEA